MQVSMAQIRVKSGDIEGNLSRILGALEEVPESTDVVLFPEMCISGYNVGCLFEYEQFIQDCTNAVERVAQAARSIRENLIVVVGAPRFATAGI
jgi:NAD+ synthase (glutamine-hydrolysing)